MSHLGEGACGGCHLPYSIVMLLRVDDEYNILSRETRVKALAWLRKVSDILDRLETGEGRGWCRAIGLVGCQRAGYTMTK